MPRNLHVPKAREVVEIHVHVARDENVHEAVFVVIGPGCAGHEAAAADSGFVGDVFKGAIAAVAIERVAAVSGDEYIENAIVVEVSYGDAHAPTFAGESALASS